jgi:3-hydroxybutyryl-CoA dehydrogenase
MWREAMALIDEGTCDAATIDHVVKTSFGLRLSVMGPVENADFVGLDTTLAIHKYVFPALSRSTTPASALQLRVERGDLGAKTGRGFYEWSTEARESAAARLRTRVLELLGRDSPTGDGH